MNLFSTKLLTVLIASNNILQHNVSGVQLVTLKKNIHAHGQRHLPRNLSQERSIEIGNQLSYCASTVVVKFSF